MFEKNPVVQQWLQALIAAEGGVAGGVPVQRGRDLFLVAAHNLPPPVVQVVAVVPYGKGMAGAAQVKKAPVQTCNLQRDDSGVVKPGAKAVDAQAAIALPVLDSAGEPRAVVGIAWLGERTLSQAEEQALME